MRELVSGTDFLVMLVLLTIIYCVARNIQEKRIDTYAYYSHFTRALFLRIFSGLLFACVYILYYDGGDTQYYFTGSRSIVKMAGKNFMAFVQIMFGERTPELRSLFDGYTGWPTYFKDANSWAVCRFSTLFYLLGLGSYIGTTIVMNALLFIPIWRFYRMMVRIYPHLSRSIAVALFYIPSVCFWGAGLLKDIWCMVGVLGVYYSCYMIFKRERFIFGNVIRFLFWAYVLTSIRPYAFYTVFATCILWIGLMKFRNIENKFIRVAFFPMMAITLLTVFIVFLDNMGDVAEGKYASVGSMMEQAVIIQDDLKRDYYGDNSFDIGTFDASLTGMLKKLPQALLAGLFRPFLWEARTPFMLLSGLENFAILLLSLYVILKMRMGVIRALKNDSFLLSLSLFVFIFGFFIGLTIANFGALVRYRIILLPFFVIMLFQLLDIYRKSSEEEE
ncbi:MAG: hypothetical protein MJ197_05305 [Bacteroidales bacterium]|nr:hypothetical protein [Bacteroidales bacterium]